VGWGFFFFFFFFWVATSAAGLYRVQSYRICVCLSGCDLETSTVRRPRPELGRCPKGGVGRGGGGERGGEQENKKQYDFTLQTTNYKLQTTRRHIPRSSRRIFMLNQKSHKRNSESSEFIGSESS